MADTEKQKITVKERQKAKVEQLKAKLQNEEAKLRAQARKDRDAQLMALGIIFEQVLLNSDHKQIDIVAENAKDYLKGRTLKNALAALERISKERKELARKKEISSEPPSQLPEAEAQEKNQGSA